MTVTLSPQQDQAAAAFKAWMADKGRKKKPFFYLAGYAGSGKSFLASTLAQEVETAVFAAFTGKAALVMRSKGCEGASTIHSLIYKPIDRGDGTFDFKLNRDDSAAASADLIVIDEVSMVGDDLGKDLLSFKKPILVLGDPAQLPPVNGAGFFTSGDPDFMLTEIHRQARDNPIIRLSMDVRNGNPLALGDHGDSRVIERSSLGQRRVLDADQVLCGLNRTRRSFNARIRALTGRDPSQPFVTGERVVSLRNSQTHGLLNGSIWEVTRILEQTQSETEMTVKPCDAGMVQSAEVLTHHSWLTGEERSLDPVEARRRYQPFDYGYCLSVHKAQGSQWDDVVIFDESGAFRDDAQRWLYTAITRAAVRLTLVQ